MWAYSQGTAVDNVHNALYDDDDSKQHRRPLSSTRGPQGVFEVDKLSGFVRSHQQTESGLSTDKDQQVRRVPSPSLVSKTVLNAGDVVVDS